MVKISFLSFFVALSYCTKKNDNKSKEISNDKKQKDLEPNKDRKYTIEEDGFEFWTDNEDDEENGRLPVIYEEDETSESSTT